MSSIEPAVIRDSPIGSRISFFDMEKEMEDDIPQDEETTPGVPTGVSQVNPPQ